MDGLLIGFFAAGAAFFTTTAGCFASGALGFVVMARSSCFVHRLVREEGRAPRPGPTKTPCYLEKMPKLTTALLLFISAAALASPSDDLNAASRVALEEAKDLSLDGKYSEAVATLLAVDTKFRPLLPAGDRYQLESLKGVRTAYETRAQAARKAGADPKASRTLLLSLLEPARSELDTAAPSDKRVLAVLEKLRKLDPRAKKFFSPRPVRVVVTGEGLSASESATLVEGVVGPLRALGFAASAKEGAETLTLAVQLGKEVKDIAKGDGPLGVLPETSMSCELKVDASWTEGTTQLIRFDLSRRGLGFSDIPGQCVAARIKEIPALVAPRLVKRWDSDSAP